jgi:hypothetical protein
MVRSLFYLAPLWVIGVSSLGLVSAPILAQTKQNIPKVTAPTPAAPQPSAVPSPATADSPAPNSVTPSPTTPRPKPLFSKPTNATPSGSTPPAANQAEPNPMVPNPNNLPPANPAAATPLPVPAGAVPPVGPNPGSFSSPGSPGSTTGTIAGTVTASLRSAGCSNRLLSDLQPSQPVAIGRENYNANFYLEGTAQPGFLTCGLTNPSPSTANAIAPNTLGALQQVKLQFGLADNLPPTARATVAAYVDGKLWRSVTLRPKTPATTWVIPAQDKKSLTLEVACPGNCNSRVYFTQADLEFPVIIATTPPAPPPETVAQERRPEDRQATMRRVENTFRILNWVRIFMPF